MLPCLLFSAFTVVGPTNAVDDQCDDLVARDLCRAPKKTDLSAFQQAGTIVGACSHIRFKFVRELLLQIDTSSNLIWGAMARYGEMRPKMPPLTIALLLPNLATESPRVYRRLS